MVVAFHVHRRPLSSGASLAQGYKDALTTAARLSYSADPIHAIDLYTRIIWFHQYTISQGDIDNISKKIHDSLIGIVYTDDRWITHTMAVRVDTANGVDLAIDPAHPDSGAKLLESLSDVGIRDVLYIEVGIQTDKRVYLGPPR